MSRLFLLLPLWFGSILAPAQSTIRLYTGKAPGSESWNWAEATFDVPNGGTRFVYNVVDPELLVYPAPRNNANGTSIIVAPGGAFHFLSIDNEGIEVARWLNSKGITAFVLKYRVVHSLTNNPMQELSPLMSDFRRLDEINAPVVELARDDGIAAMKFVKEHAAEYGLDPKKIGFMGFSAGGTLTMSVMMSAPQVLKPSFAAPIYLYKKAVLGQVMPDAITPLFIAVATDDQLGFVPHSIDLYNQWFVAKQPVELHVYDKGGHGFGMHKNGTSSDNWTTDFENWLKAMHFL